MSRIGVLAILAWMESTISEIVRFLRYLLRKFRIYKLGFFNPMSNIHSRFFVLFQRLLPSLVDSSEYS